MESQPQNPKFRINPENIHAMEFQLLCSTGSCLFFDAHPAIYGRILLCNEFRQKLIFMTEQCVAIFIALALAAGLRNDYSFR